MKLFLMLNNQKNFFNFHFVTKFILCIFFVNVSCNDLILYSSSSTSPSENSSTIYADVTQLLEQCFADHLNPIIISPELFDEFDFKFSEAIKTSMIVIGLNFKPVKSKALLHNSYPTYLIVGDTTDKLTRLLKELKSSPLWSIKSKFFIVGTSGKSCLRDASEFLNLLWTNNLLSSFYLCPKSRNFTMVYTFNPFTNYAPHPWKKKDATKKPNFRWTLYNLRFIKGKDMCHNLDFDKTKLLNDFRINAVTRDLKRSCIKKDIFHFLNLRMHKHYDKTLSRKIASRLFKNSTYDICLTCWRLEFMEKKSVDILPIYYQEYFLIALKKKMESLPPEIDSVIDSHTGIYMIIILSLFVITIALINNYQFGAAILDVYRLLIDNDPLFPINRLSSHVVLFTAFLFVFAFSPALEGQFFALLTKPTYRTIETLKDLYDYKYHVYCTINVKKEILRAGLWTTDEDKKYLHENGTLQSLDCLELASKDSTVACIDIADFILVNAPKYELHISEDKFFPTYYSVMTRRNWALKDRVGKKTLQSFEAGLTYYELEKKVMNQQKRLKAIGKESKLEQYDLVDATDLIYLYMFIALIFILAVIIFFLENIVSRLRRPRLLVPENFEL